jgi:hypothetical protein
MVTFSYIEEYLQFIAGTRSLTNQITLSWLAQPVISLARYDKSVVASFAEQIANSIPFTDRQAELARRLVKNYRRQLHRLGVQVPDDVTQLPFKLPLRTVDRTKRMYIKDGRLCMQFPYSVDLINSIKEFSSSSEGNVAWDPDNKVWQFALTESCVNWAHAFGTATSFEITPDIAKLAADIIVCEQQPYEIKLVKTGAGFSITNAPPPMLEYIEERGGLGLDNELVLLDLAAEMGYTISDELLETSSHPNFLKSKRVHVSSEHNDVTVIVDYAKTFNKFPIVSLNTVTTGRAYLDALNSQFDDDEIVYLTNYTRKGLNRSIDEKTKLIHVDTTSIKSWTGPMPLAITYTNMTFGAIKSIVLREASKMCYYTACDYTHDRD